MLYDFICQILQVVSRPNGFYLFGLIFSILVFWLPSIEVPHIGYVASLGLIAIGSSIGFAGDKPIILLFFGFLIFIVTFIYRHFYECKRNKFNGTQLKKK